MPSPPRSVTSLMMLICSSQVSVAMINCNHAMITEDSSVVVADVCYKYGDNSQMLQCRDGEGYLKMWLLNDECDESHTNVVETLVSEQGIEAVCDADPCHIAVIEVFDDGSESSDHESGHSGDSESDDYSPSNSTYNGSEEQLISSTTFESDEQFISSTSLNEARRLLSSHSSSEHSHSHSGSESASSESSSCDNSGTPTIAAFIVGACQPTDVSESIRITCTGTHDAMVEYFADDEDHECSGTATFTATASVALGEQCGNMVACNVEAGVASTLAPTVAPTVAPTDAAPTVAVFAPLLMMTAVLLNA